MTSDPTKRTVEALSTFNNGFNCAQAVLSAFAPDYNLDRETALRIASGLGAGLGFQGKICGAVLGAYLVLSLRYGSSSPNDELSKEVTYHLTREFDHAFVNLHGSLNCKELLDTDLSTQEGHARAIEWGLFDTLCQDFVSDSIRILEQLLERKT